MFGKNTDYINSVCTQHAVHPWAFPQGWSAPKSAELWSNWATTKSGESTCGHINIFTHLQNRTWSRSLSNSMGLVLDAILKSRRGVGVNTMHYESSTSTSQELSSTIFQRDRCHLTRSPLFSCPGQLNRWHCQSVIKTDFWFQRLQSRAVI